MKDHWGGERPGVCLGTLIAVFQSVRTAGVHTSGVFFLWTQGVTKRRGCVVARRGTTKGAGEMDVEKQQSAVNV